jgi:phosphopantothenoylcysteine decarboxylase/phosphopantothenate--cysteine ligase
MGHGMEVQALMTSSAQKFLTSYSLEILTGKPVLTEVFESAAKNHITLVASNPLFLIAPASANMISKIAGGVTDDIISLCANVCLGASTKLLFAPAMNPAMWKSPILQSNVNRLQDAGAHFVGPHGGIEILTLQETPIGGMANPAQIVEKILELTE